MVVAPSPSRSKPVFSEYGRELAHWKIGATSKSHGSDQHRARDDAVALVEPRRSPLAVDELVLGRDRDAVAAVRRGRLAAPRARVRQHVAQRQQAASPAAADASSSRLSNFDSLVVVNMLICSSRFGPQPGGDERAIEVAAVHAAHAARIGRRRARIRRVADALDARVDRSGSAARRCRACGRSRSTATSRRPSAALEADRHLLHVRLLGVRIVDAAERAGRQDRVVRRRRRRQRIDAVAEARQLADADGAVGQVEQRREDLRPALRVREQREVLEQLVVEDAVAAAKRRCARRR